MIDKKYVESKAKVIKERRNATQNIASVILITGIFVPWFLSAGNHCGHQLDGEERCASFEALLKAINLWPNARLKAFYPPAFQSVGRTRKQREREASGFAGRLWCSLFSRSSYTDLMSFREREPVRNPAKCELNFHSHAFWVYQVRAILKQKHALLVGSFYFQF